MRAVEFGYSPPSGDRISGGALDPRAFLAELHAAMEVAAEHFDSVWLPDHVMGGSHFRLECWTELAWIAARYPRVQVGTVVLDHAFRPPALLAKMAATLQLLSGGRVVLGYGAGWMESEHRAYGYDFASPGTRVRRMVEGIEVMRALWTSAPANYHGRYYQLADAYCEPRPEPIPPIMIGGAGEQLMLRAVARHADWWNTMIRDPQTLRHKLDVLARHCHAIERDPATIRRTVGLIAYLAPSRAEAERLAGPALNRPNPPFAGEPAALLDALHELVDLGVDLFQIMFAGMPARQAMDLFVGNVLPEFGGAA